MKGEVQKAMGLLKQAMACLEGYGEDGDEEEAGDMESNAPEGDDEDLAQKSFKMKLSKYK